MRSSMIGLLAFGVAVAIQGCGGTTTDSGGAGTGSGGKQGVGGTSGSKSTGGAPGVGGTTGSVGGSGGDPGTGGVPPTGGAGGAPGVGGAGGGGTCAPPSCAGCFDCFSSCFCQTSAAEECKLACSGGTGGAGGAPASCDELTKEVYARLDAAKACCPVCDSIQCTGSVPGLCCPETVGNANSGETQSYLEALKRLQGSNCSVACPAIPCGPAEPSYNCVPGPAGNGRCQ